MDGELEITPCTLDAAQAKADADTVTTPWRSIAIGFIRRDLLTLLGAVLAALLVWFALINTPATASTTPYVDVWSHLILLVFMGGMIGLLRRPLAARWRTNVGLLWLGLFFLALLTLRLKDTPFTVGGINGDARFYTTYITKLAAYPGYGDMFYKDLPAFYPPLYYFLVARVAEWFTIEPFRVMKYALFTTVMVLPLTTGWLWRRLVAEPLVLAAPLCMLVFPDWFKPNEWLALALFVPWWLHWVDNCTADQPQTRGGRWLWWLSGGLIGALIFQLYFFWFFVGGVALLVQIGHSLWGDRPTALTVRPLAHSLLMLGLTAVLSSPFWAPYLYSLLTTPGAEPLQNRFFGESKAPLPLYFFEASWQGVVYFGGLLYILLAAAVDPIARGLRRLVVGFAVWVALGYVAILVDMPLLTFRSYPLLAYLLGVGAFLGLLRLATNAGQLAQHWPQLPWRLLATTLLTPVILLFANGVVTELLGQENVQDAVDATYPTAELAAFDTLTANDYRNRVALVTDSSRSVLFFRPLYSFLAWSAHFSHPAGQFHRRADFLEKLARLHDPQLFAAALAHNQYDQVDYLLLGAEAGYWRYKFVDDNFPNRTIDREIRFPQALLAETYFQTSTADGYSVITVRETPMLDPLTLTAPLTGAALVAAAQRHVLATTFAPDVPLAPETAATTNAALLTADLTALPVATLLDLRASARGELADAVQTALAARLQLAQPMILTDDSGQPRVALLGYELLPHAAGEREIALYWQALTALEESYTVWFHAFPAEPAGEKHIFDHTPPLATNLWSPGAVYVDRFTLPLPAGAYRLETGLWAPEQDRRLWLPTGELGITIENVSLP
jgi:hypothetical protein